MNNKFIANDELPSELGHYCSAVGVSNYRYSGGSSPVEKSISSITRATPFPVSYTSTSSVSEGLALVVKAAQTVSEGFSSDIHRDGILRLAFKLIGSASPNRFSTYRHRQWLWHRQ